MFTAAKIYPKSSSYVCIHNLCLRDHCLTRWQQQQQQKQQHHLMCKVIRIGQVQNSSAVNSNWKARGIKKQQSHSTVNLAYCWFGVSFLAFSLSHPITARWASKLSRVFSTTEKALAEVSGRLRLWWVAWGWKGCDWPRIKSVTQYVGL